MRHSLVWSPFIFGPWVNGTKKTLLSPAPGTDNARFVKNLLKHCEYAGERVLHLFILYRRVSQNSFNLNRFSCQEEREKTWNACYEYEMSFSFSLSLSLPPRELPSDCLIENAHVQHDHECRIHNCHWHSLSLPICAFYCSFELS